MSLNAPSINMTALPGIPIVQPGDDLVRLILDGLERAGLTLEDGDALVVTSKIVSKSEGRTVRLSDVVPGEEALRVAAETGKDARLVELVLGETRRISRAAPNVLIVEHRLGFVSANAGIDQSNLTGGDDCVLLLPRDPDASAEGLREGLGAATGADIGVIISDSHGRPFRVGNVGVAIGVAGMPAVVDLRGQTDLFGRVLRISIQGYADMVAGSSGLLTGEGAEGRPVVLLRGLNFPKIGGRAAQLHRAPEHDLYR